MTEKKSEGNIQQSIKYKNSASEDAVQVCNHGNSADRFFEDLNKNQLSFKFTDIELEDLQCAVHELVVKVLQSAETREDRYKCSEILRVGSFQEGTKILEPNEFDYLAVIEELSDPCKVEAVRVCSNSRGYMHLRVKDESLKGRWHDFIDNDELLGFAYDNPSVKSQRALSSILFDIYMSQTSSEQSIVVVKESGKLKFAGCKILREPNTELIFTWKTKDREGPFVISVDISPAVRCFNFKEAVTVEDCPDESTYKIVCDHGSFLLTCGRQNRFKSLPSKCFRISLTEVEVALVQKMSSTHKMCYRTLKYFFVNMCGELSLDGFIYDGLSSYCLKTAVLHHQILCLKSMDGSVKSCTESVISFLLRCLVRKDSLQPCLPSIFIKDHNLFTTLAGYKTNRNIALNLALHVKCITSFLSLIKTLKAMSPSEYSYLKCFAFLRSTLTDIEKTKQEIAENAKQFIGSDGKWNGSDLSTENVLSQFGIT